MSQPFALAISSPGSIVDPWTTCNIIDSRVTLLSMVILTMREFALRARKSRTRSVRVDTQYVALVSLVYAATTKGDSPLEEMSI